MNETKDDKVVKLYREAKKNLVRYRYLLLENDPEHEVSPADYHFDWSDMLLKETGNMAIQGFRESGKSQYVLRSLPLYCLTFPTRKRDYIVLIKNNATLAEKKLKEIEEEYKTNGLIAANKAEIKEQSASVFSVDVKNSKDEIINIRIEAYGKGSSIRGLSNRERRPKLVICDDLQDRDEMRGMSVPEDDWRWFMSDVYFLGKTCRIFLIGNNLGEKCIVERILSSKDDLNYKTFRVSSIKTEKDPSILDAYREVSAWPTQFKLEDIYKQREVFRRQGLLDIWQEEKMCVATSEETKTFKKADRRYYVTALAEKIRQNCNVCATLDPASSKEVTAAFRAIVVKGIDKDNHWFVLDILYGRWDSTELIDKMFEAVVKWHFQDFGIEKGQLKQVIEPFIHKEMAKRNQFFNIVPIEHAKAGSKLERVKMLSPRYAAHTIWHPETAPWLAEFESELDGVTKNGFKSLFVDLIDAFSMHEQIGEAPMNSADVANLPRTAMPDNTNLKQIVMPGYQPQQALPRTAMPMNTPV